MNARHAGRARAVARRMRFIQNLYQPRQDDCTVCNEEYAKGSAPGSSFAVIDSWIRRKPIKFDLSTAPPEAPRSRPAGVARTSHALPDFRASAKVPVAGAAQ